MDYCSSYAPMQARTSHKSAAGTCPVGRKIFNICLMGSIRLRRKPGPPSRNNSARWATEPQSKSAAMTSKVRRKNYAVWLNSDSMKTTNKNMISAIIMDIQLVNKDY
jgi:hypothetical protein